ncbi:SPOSA6832_03840, partial [Sporobolomyces salmonicolor]
RTSSPSAPSSGGVLPFNCPSCKLPFCAEHWRPPSGHTCTQYDPRLFDVRPLPSFLPSFLPPFSSVDLPNSPPLSLSLSFANARQNRVPSCPLCSTPIPIPPQTDPNLPMDSHLSTTCPVLHPHLPKPKPANVCNAPKCKVKMVVPIQCDECGGKFCPQHRWRGDHKCEGRLQVKANGGGVSVARAANRAAAPARDRPAATTGLSGLAALRRAQDARASTTSKAPAHFSASSKPAPAKLGTSANPLVLLDSSDSDDIEILPPRPGPATPAASSSNSSGGTSKKMALASIGLGSRTDKRARAEQESARKALETRAKKGLLTEDEKVRYATMQALQQRGSSFPSKAKGGGEGCVMA